MLGGADFLRVHNVHDVRVVVDVFNALTRDDE
jgi:hypothetical protein